MQSVRPQPKAAVSTWTLSILFAAALCAAGLPSASAGLINLPDTVLVGDLGNASDVTGHGYVNDPYEIGRYEVTVSQFVTFLNAVASTDTYGLFPARQDEYSQITRSGAAGHYTYQAIAGTQNLPVVRVSWFTAARYCNWLTNHQPSGAQDSTTTEYGAYDLSLGALVTRLPTAVWALPTIDEWYKAAYYDPTKNTTGGYWLYPNQSDEVIVRALDGTPSSLDPDVYFPQYPVGGVADNCSYYGTWDQGGNVGEWTEQEIEGQRGIRGGALRSAIETYASYYGASSDPGLAYRDIGFRVVNLSPNLGTPEPATLGLLALGGAAVVAIRRRVRSPRAWANGPSVR